MIDTTAFQRAELDVTLRQLQSFALSAPPAAEHAGSKLLAFAQAASSFVEAFQADPEASPAALLLAAGEAHAQLEALQRTFDGAMDQIDRLPFRLEVGGGEAADLG